MDGSLAFPHSQGRTERSVEIPWALDRYRGGKRILEVGCSFAYENPEYVAGLKSLGAEELHGIDISAVPAPDFIKRIADIRASGYPSDFFDTVFCISTIEHVGRDNSRYYEPVAEAADGPEPDRAALLEMLRITRPGGSILLTLPFGKFEDHGWFINYDAAQVSRLFRELPPVEAEYFRYSDDGWLRCAPEELADAGYRENGAPAAAGVACFEIS
ncbi:MAG TPA: methyltransferase domain-containing protein [Chthoniobacterales bacterium]|jgi:O-antigen chain-terminating methyltransferase